ncbi:MAG: glucan biosynthesis protein [Verrucomicrobium sp.]|nr:glucan biosynthesis protein [Verrucomicrobium sp.]
MRLHVTLALVTALILYVAIRHTPGRAFRFAQVEAMAAKLAQERFVPAPDVLPPALRKLTPEQEGKITWKEAYRVWRDKGLPFQVDFYHVTREFPTGPRINVVDRRGPHPLAYAPSFFDFKDLDLRPPLPAALPYAGFYLRYPLNKPDSLDGFFSAMGASYFRAIGRHEVYGLSARGLAIDTASPEHKEEFPAFTEWWLQRPVSDATEMTLYALLDSPSVAGAYEFKVRPGNHTAVDVHAVLHFRKSMRQVGLAPFSSMYFYGENSGSHYGDTLHPEIHDSDGLLLWTGNDEWVWQPLHTEPFIQLYQRPEKSPRGFGLLQRDRDFQHYQDLETLYNVRPSAWVTPHGDWGKGNVTLMQLPTDNTNTDNVVLFWQPEKAPQAGDRMEFSYTIDFYMTDNQRPPLGTAEATHVSTPPPPAPGAKPVLSPTGTVPVTFVIDFWSDALKALPAHHPPDLELAAEPAGTVIRTQKLERNGYDGSWRVTFTAEPLKRQVPTVLRCRLLRGGKPMTETWTYTWHQ